jgi:hypothetical protein
MRIRTTAAGLLLAALATSCTTAEAPATPTPAATTEAKPSATTAADTYEDCVAAIAKDPEAEPPPAPCDTLSDKDYLEANLEGLHRHNKAARDALGDAIAEASEAAEN